MEREDLIKIASQKLTEAKGKWLEAEFELLNKEIIGGFVLNQVARQQCQEDLTLYKRTVEEARKELNELLQTN